MAGEATADAASAWDELRAIAPTLNGLDSACYQRFGRDPFEPVLGLGAPDARWCFVGRDPGEQEVREGKPFVGVSGRRIRAVMAAQGVDDADVFWMNTVPFKPVGNRPWPLSVRRRCRPALLRLLATWQGRRVVTFGEAAFHWFGLGDAAMARSLAGFWQRPDRFDRAIEVTLDLPRPQPPRPVLLLPLPHPSGANARWAARFPQLLQARLDG